MRSVHFMVALWLGLIAAASPVHALIISEIMYHPSGADDRVNEWIELYNELPDPLDLSGYSFCNGINFEFPPGTWLEGRSVLVVCARKANVLARYGITNTVGDWFIDPGSSPSLSNGGERIDICNTGGKVIVTVRYNDRGKWEAGPDGTGHSLEIESPYKEIDDPDSWDISNDVGGSPGYPNPCWLDDGNGPPQSGGPVGSFGDHIDVGFPCTPGDTTFVAGTGRYTVTGSGFDIWAGGDQFQFAYVKAQGNFDIKVRLVARTWSTDRWGKGGIMARQDLTASSRYMFVHDSPDPDGARLAERPTHGGGDNAEPHILADGTHPNWYRLQRVGDNITGYHGSNGTAWTAFGPARTWNGGSTLLLGLALTSHSNCGVATLVWDSLSISGTILPPDGPGGGPGTSPYSCAPVADVRINEAYLRVNPGDTPFVELHNTSATSIDIGGYYLTDDPASLKKFQIPAATSIAAGGHRIFTEAQLGFSLAVTLLNEQRFLALVESDPRNRVVDAQTFEPDHLGYSEARLPNDDKSFTDAADPTPGAVNAISVNTDVVINEVMYHTIDNDSRKEYVEIYNKGGVAHDLTGWSFTDGINFDFPDGTVIPAGGYLVVTREPALFTGGASIYQLAANQVLGPETPEAALIFGGLRNSGERLTIEDQLRRVVDTVRYHDGGQWARWADGLGSSLELIDATQDNRLGQAWDASDDSSKATAQVFSYATRHGNRDTELALALMSRGTVVVDDLSVLSGGINTMDTPLIETGDTWRYLKGTVAPPVDWHTLGFADDSWSSGPTGIGYGDSDDATTLDDMLGNYMTVFCRSEFTVADKSTLEQLILSVVIDDGFYAYLNGTEVASYNVTSPAFDAAAPSAIEPGTPVEIDISAFKTVLVNGSNVLSVQVHNAGLASSDLSFIPRLLNRTTSVGGGGTQHLTNGTFNSNTAGWVIEGTHIKSGRTTVNPINGAGSLRIVATGRGDNKVNRIETPTAAGSGMTNIGANTDVEISFKARWVIGSQTLLTNGYDHEMARAHTLGVPLNLGTPGARNQVTQRLISQSGGSNQGPVLTDVSQDPVVPSASEAVIVRARILDSDGVGTATLRYALNNPSASPASVAMSRIAGTDFWQGTIPAQAQGVKVVFFINATDAGGRVGRYPVDVSQRSHPPGLNPPTVALNDQRYCIYRHDIANPASNYLNYRFWMTDSSATELSNRQRLSNDPIDGSFVFGGSTIYYESKTRFSGSPWARGGWGGSFKVRMPGDEPLHGRINKFGLEDNQGNPIDSRTRITHYLLRQNQGTAGTPYTEGFALVRWQVNDNTSGVREHNWVPDGEFLSLWFPGDDEGDFLEMDDRFLIDDAGNRAGSVDGRVLYPPPYATNDANGANEENYRWFFGLRAKNGADEFANFIALANVMDPARTNDATFDQQIWDVANVEEILRILAVRTNISDWDTWGTERGKNCYFYRTEIGGLWHLIAWDSELTYELGRVQQFLVPTAPGSTFSMGNFSEANRLVNRPKIKRMFYSILNEMVNGSGRWFHSDYLGDYADRLSTFGMANTGIAQAGGYIDQRSALIRTRIASVLYPTVRLAITTNGGNNITTGSATVNLAGNAPSNICEFLITNNGDAGTVYTPTYTSMTAWSINGLALTAGVANVLVIYGIDLQGNIVDQDTITVTSTTAWQAPAITLVSPDSALAGSTVEITGSNFHNGVRVFFGGAEATNVVYDENGANPERISARIPNGTGTVNVSVRNSDNQNSNTLPFTYTEPPPLFIRGDANGDGSVDIADAMRILRHLFASIAVNCQDAGDVDDNEALNVTDATVLLNYIFKSGTAPRAPFPIAGADPSGNTLGCQR